MHRVCRHLPQTARMRGSIAAILRPLIRLFESEHNPMADE
jgi:hypothetical protein